MAVESTDGARREPRTGPSVAETTCYMCACRCGIRVHLADGVVRYIEGNPDHPVNRGVLCAKGAAGAMNHYSPARLRAPLRRSGPRGSGRFEEISWSEAIATAAGWLAHIRAENPRRLAFFTGRDQSQALTGWWAQMFGTPNYAAHGGFCSVNMAAAGLYTIGSSFWEFGEPDWDRARYLLLFGVAEDHGSNPIKIGLGTMRAHGAKIVSINPIRTGYSALADEWLGITPGTDGLLVLALVHELLRAGKVDVDYLARSTNAGWLVVRNPGAADDGLVARAEDGRPLCWDRKRDTAHAAFDVDARPALTGTYRWRDRDVVPVFQLIAERYLDQSYAPSAVAARTGISAETIRRIAAEIAYAAFDESFVLDIPWTDWAGRHHDGFVARPVAVHAMRGISAHANGFQTCRAIHLLQALLGSVDSPGGYRHKPPYPRGFGDLPRPTGGPGECRPDAAMTGPVLGFPAGPEELLVDTDGTPCRIDKAFSWEAPLAVHGLMHMTIENAAGGDPYPIDTLFLYMANMAWNSAMNPSDTMSMLTARDEETGEYNIPHIIYVDAFESEMVAYADLVLPDTTYLERWDCISLLDRPIGDPDGPADSIRRPVVLPDRDVRPFQDVLIELGGRLGLPGFVDESGAPRYPGGYADYLVNHERRPGIGMLAGWRDGDSQGIGVGGVNAEQLDRYIENDCFWRAELPPSARFLKHVNKDYLEHATKAGYISFPEPVFLQLYSEPLQRFRLAAQGHGRVQPPERERARIERHFDPLPFWSPPFEDLADQEQDYPLHAVTQRPMAMYHSWGAQNAWLRQIHGTNRLYLPQPIARAEGIEDGDWIWVESRHDRIKVRAAIMAGVNAATVWTWNAIGKRAGAWALDPEAPESKQGFLLNHLIDSLLPPGPGGFRYANADPVTGQAAWYDLRVRIRKAETGGQETQPAFDATRRPPRPPHRPAVLQFTGRGRPGLGEEG